MPRHEGTKAAIYVRVSTEEQAEEGQSLEAQRKALHAYAASHGLEVVAEYADEGKSARTADRPQFQAMIKAARSKPKPFDVILVHKYDRFARNREDAIVYKSLLRRECSVEVVSVLEPVDDSPVGRLLEGILEVLSEFYSLNLAQETRKGMKEKAAKGRVLNMVPVGYRAGEDGKYQIAPEQAEAIRWIFHTFAKGDMGRRAIAVYLATEGPARFGNWVTRYKWSAQSVRVILSNRAYVGEFVWNRRDNSQKGRFRDPAEWIVVENAHEPIVDRELFDEVQRRLSIPFKRKLNPGRDYLLWSFVRCLDCSGSMSAFSFPRRHGSVRVLQCNRYHNTGQCHPNSLQLDKAEAAVISYLEQVARGEVSDMELVPTGQAGSEIGEAKRELARVEERFRRTKVAYENGILDLEELREAKARRDAEKTALEAKLERLQSASNSPSRIAKLRREARSVLKSLADTSLSVDERRQALGRIVDHVAWSRAQNRLQIVLRG